MSGYNNNLQEENETIINMYSWYSDSEGGGGGGRGGKGREMNSKRWRTLRKKEKMRGKKDG